MRASAYMHASDVRLMGRSAAWQRASSLRIHPGTVDTDQLIGSRRPPGFRFIDIDRGHVIEDLLDDTPLRQNHIPTREEFLITTHGICLLYTSDAADDL